LRFFVGRLKEPTTTNETPSTIIISPGRFGLSGIISGRRSQGRARVNDNIVATWSTVPANSRCGFLPPFVAANSADDMLPSMAKKLVSHRRIRML